MNATASPNSKLSHIAPTRRPPWRSSALLLVASVALTLGIIAAESIVALAIVVMDLGLAWAGMIGAVGLGSGLIRALGVRPQDLAARWLVSGCLGIGVAALLILMLGSLGVLTPATSMVLLCLGFVIGLARLLLDLTESRKDEPLTGRHYLWLTVFPFITIALLAMCLPPGVLWAEEAYGYDVLEYHLAVPKTFLEQGRITFLPHNVYSNFPLNSEMLSLWMMAIKRDPIEAAHLCKAVNIIFMMFFIATAWRVGTTFSRNSGIIAGVLAGTTPWVAYLAGIAFVEIGMLAMGMAALLALTQMPRDARHAGRWALTAGLLAGLACGFKYTAVPLVALPMVLLLLVNAPCGKPRLQCLTIYALGAFVSFCPWMIRNAINTHNPVFPLAYSFFGAKEGTWDDVLAERFGRGHYDSGEDERLDTTLKHAFNRTAGDMRLGIVPFLLAAIGVVRYRRDRLTWALAAMCAMQLFIWLTMTHLFARFAVVMLIPLLALAARAVEGPLPKWLRFGWAPLIALAAAWNLVQFAGLYYDHTRVDGRLIDAYGRVDEFEAGGHTGRINQLVDNASVMLVGEARSYYLRRRCEYATAFNHHPITAVLNENASPPEIVQWLRQRGTTHVLAHWTEIERLKRTYGFDDRIGPALFEQLDDAGLRPIEVFGDDEIGVYGTLYEVVDHE